MGKRNKGSFKKRGKIHRHRCKGERNTLPSKNRNARLAMSADPSTCQGRKKRSSNVAAAAPQNNFQLNANVSSTTMPMQPTFQKFKDGLAKKPLKRLKSKPNKTINKKSYSQKLLKSIKQRAFNSSKNAEHKAKRQLSFQSDRKKQQQRLLLPKPKFYSNYQQAAGSSIAIKESQIIEEIVSSDEDDCIVLEPIVAEIKIDDESDDETQVKPAVNTDEDDNIPSCSNFGVDTHREIQLWEKFSSDKSSFAYNLPSNDSCIIINDSYEHSNIDSSPARIIDRKNDGLVNSRNQKSNNELDDSVIFVEEDFIPLPSDDDIKPKMKRKGEKNVGAKIEEDDVQFVQVQRLASMDTSLFTKTERRKLADYNSNTYNPNVETNAPVTHKRSIIIDGSNVAFGHGRSNIFSAEGVKYCVEYFKKMGHDVKAVIPLFRRNAFKSSNPALLDQLHKEGSIVFTPCKNLPNQQSISYDDRFILQLAYERNAAILSNDNYRDLIHENAAFKKIIENRVIGYSWCDNILILPKDPYGRFGPPLSEILRC